MASEGRFERRVVGKAFDEFYQPRNKIQSRLCMSPSRIGYVFLRLNRSDPRDYRIAQLGLRCLVARDKLDSEGCKRIVGIATESKEDARGFSLDLCLIDFEIWTSEEADRAKKIANDFGYFTQPITKSKHEDEYPFTR
jgi:hypothetical protein